MILMIFAFSLILSNSSQAHSVMQCGDEFLSATEYCTSIEASYFDVKICLNAGPISLCFTLRCDLHWTDILQPGLGQLLGHEGCKVIGSATNGNGPTYSFDGNAEDMIASVEQAMNVPKGSLKIFDVLESPTFPLPDGKEYRVVAKNYTITRDANGTSVPLEVEVVQ